MANWYKELLDINVQEKIVAVCAARNIWVKEKSKIYTENIANDELIKIMDYEFDGGYGGEEGPSFTAWTHSKVFFPVVYDGSEWIESVPRNPCNTASPHLGG